MVPDWLVFLPDNTQAHVRLYLLEIRKPCEVYSGFVTFGTIWYPPIGKKTPQRCHIAIRDMDWAEYMTNNHYMLGANGLHQLIAEEYLLEFLEIPMIPGRNSDGTLNNVTDASTL